jgi:hypothetical protein
MAQYDIQQVCLKGHRITGAMQCSPGDSKEFCPKCGAKTIYQCPNCNAEIQGARIELQFTGEWAPVEYQDVPSHCSSCGTPFPWTKSAPEVESPESESTEKGIGNKVFIVHGHNDSVKLEVQRFLEKLGLQPIILHEQPNEGMTIIEKFEKHSDTAFAVVLLTGDDVGYSVAEKKKSKPRARQNVILEMGFFLGKLGRNRVCALYVDGVELPSDYDGVLYVLLANDWKLSLAKEIKAAGFSVDLNKAI